MAVEQVIGDLTSGTFVVNRAVRGVIVNGRYVLAPAWEAATIYALGALVTNGGSGPPAFNRTYQVTTGGTSAGSGGPLTTATDIVDGTVHWAFVEENILSITASWRPKTGRTLASPAEGEYGSEDRTMFSLSELRTRSPGYAGTPDTESDIVVMDGENWQVIHVDRGRRFYRATLTRLPLP